MSTDYPPLDLAAFEGHTPEPWRLVAFTGRAVVQSGMDNPICLIDEELDYNAQGTANANLIAAAPQLLRERCELLAELKYLISSYDWPQHDDEARCSALIARIEGQQ